MSVCRKFALAVSQGVIENKTELIVELRHL